MPPKGRSGGSSHSSHSSHSSYRSSSHSSSSRSFSSGPGTSGRGSSHNSTGSLFGGLFGDSTYDGYQDQAPRRRRVNQPLGYDPSSVLMRTILYQGLLHDYEYYPEDFTGSDGRTYKRGYYDENGTYYQNVGIDKQEVELECPYCGTRNKIVWKEGVLPSCPNCGGTYQVQEDKINGAAVDEFNQAAGRTPVGKTEKSFFEKAFGFLVPAVMVVIAIAFFYTFFQGGNGGGSSGSSYTETVQESLYVPEIDRTCEWDSEKRWWYDENSECYFYFDTEVDPPQWKYWFEGVSSDFGDFGWLEYDDDQEQWFVQTARNAWERLPDNYDTEKLWHMDDAYGAP